MGTHKGKKAVSIKGPDIPPELAHLEPREALFILEYLKDFNATQAVIRAGYNCAAPWQMGHALLKKAEISPVVAMLAYERAKQLDVDGRMILQELAAIAFSPISAEITAADKTRALNLLGVHHKLWEGSRGDRVINISMTNIDLRTM